MLPNVISENGSSNFSKNLRVVAIKMFELLNSHHQIYHSIKIITCIYDTACERHNNETVTLRKHVSKYKNKRKRMVEFLRKSETRGDRILRVNSIRITKSIIILFFYGVALRCDKWRFSMYSPSIEKTMIFRIKTRKFT